MASLCLPGDEQALLLDDIDVQQFIDNNKAKNTVRKT